jgi:large subunit ribosomal protein L28
MVANNVSHAKNRTKRRQLPNIQDKRLWVGELGRYVKVRLSAAALRTVNKKGLMPYLRERGLSIKDVAR